MTKRKALHYEVVFQRERGFGGFAVKTQLRKNGKFYTAAETFCIPGRLDAKGMAELIADTLNERENGE